ncbi:MAG: NAD-dependent epimerase/dehydratase family protein [Leptospiraceae bacterium]|nr:NAD-dependent epimerase/dehydratase family protein [Leptospiraceae bacterium]
MRKKILITGSEGFIGKNLCLFLSEKKEIEILRINRRSSQSDLEYNLLSADFIIHLAGVNRPKEESAFTDTNVNLTKNILDFLIQNQKKTPIYLSSSSQAELDNPYGKSKQKAEEFIWDYAKRTGAPVAVYRLPGVFGKFSKPNYNSVVATFCYNIARGLEIKISDRTKEIELIHVDTVVSKIYDFIQSPASVNESKSELLYIIKPTYKVTLGEIADTLYSYEKSRSDLSIDKVGVGFHRALYSTFISYLPNESWSYAIPKYSDSRGVFVEMLKTNESGQFSYFTAAPGITRGEHYHHTKTEKFLVIKGKALFRFRNKVTNEFHQLEIFGENPTIVDSIPGWAHDITNIGTEQMIVMLWANEVFDRNNPDTFSSIVL